MKHSILFILSILVVSFTFNQLETETIKLKLNGVEVKERISIKSSGKIEVELPEGWRYIGGSVKIVNGEEVKKAQSIMGETSLKEFDILQFIKTNGVVGNYITFDLSVRTKSSATISSMKIPIVE